MAAATAAADDPGGWSKARWGMTEAQLLQVFGKEATRLDPPEKIGETAEDAALVRDTENYLLRAKGKPELPPQTFADNSVSARIAVFVELDQKKFRALMVPDKAGRLDSVLLTPADHADASDTLFDSLGQILVQKYGRPWKTSGDLAELQWTLPTTVITLTRWNSGLTGDTYVSIQYKKRPASRL
jgi:hypothetical protein